MSRQRDAEEKLINPRMVANDGKTEGTRKTQKTLMCSIPSAMYAYALWPLPTLNPPTNSHHPSVFCLGFVISLV